MDKIEEVKKLKQLLDDGVIDEADFKMKKAQILGISSSNGTTMADTNVTMGGNLQSNSKSLDDYEKELLRQTEDSQKTTSNPKNLKELFEQPVSSSMNNYRAESKYNDSLTENDTEFYKQERLKAKAELDAKEEVRQNRRAQQRAAQKKALTSGTNRLVFIGKWALSVFLLFFGAFALFCMIGQGIGYQLAGLIMLVQGCMLNPKISEYLNQIDFYSQYKRWIGIASVILFCLACALTPTETSESTVETATESHIYDNAVVEDVMNGTGNEVLGQYSYIEISSDKVTDEALNDWYSNYVEKQGHNWDVIVYTDKEGTGVYSMGAGITVDAGISKDSTGQYVYSYQAGEYMMAWDDASNKLVQSTQPGGIYATINGIDTGDYGQMYTYNAETDMPETVVQYFFPAGKYRVTNYNPEPNQFNVYSDETTVVDGWEQPANTASSTLIESLSTVEIEIPEGYHVEVSTGSDFDVEQVTE